MSRHNSFAPPPLPPSPSSPLRALALAACDASDLTTPPPAWLEEDVRALAPAMPPDLSPARLEVPLFRWLRVASALDFTGDLDGARQLLDRLETRGPAQLEHTDATALRALICARRGRLARQIGELDAAIDWYQEGLARSQGARNGDAWGACVQGLANAAQARGDVHTAERLTRLVTMQGDRIPHYARVAAWITRTVLHRQQGRLEAATRCAWIAHDLVEERDERRGQALVELSRLALARGQAGAARRGCEVVLGFAQTLRVRRPARSALLEALLVQWRRGPADPSACTLVEQAAEALLVEVADAADPWERLHAQLDALEALRALAQEASSLSATSIRPRCRALQRDIALTLAGHAQRGEPLVWAEQRLAALTRRTRAATALDPAVAGDEAAQAFARLAALPDPVPRRKEVVGA
ncbi:MAG TPA: hypothetical protein PKE51_08925 [Gemmatimonadaceae bacterium]|nr:hypothetical protein [Gemmatimonadaceae bacterium]